MTKDRLKEILERQTHRLTYEIEKRGRWDTLFSRIRITYFLTVLVLLIWLNSHLEGFGYFLLLTGGIAGFIVIVHFHRKVYQSKDKFVILRMIKREHIARMELNWEGIRFKPSSGEQKDHPFSKDFNIPGEHSLLHLIDTSIYPGSGQRLMEWLTTEKPLLDEVAERAEKVRELRDLQGFRDKLKVISEFTSTHVSDKDWSIEEMLSWLRVPKKTGFRNPLLALSILSMSNLVMIVLVFLGILNPLFLVAGIVLYLLGYKSQDTKIAGLFDSAYNMEKIISRFKESLLYIEEFRFSNKPNLAEFLVSFQESERKPSTYLKKVQKLMSRASLQVNQIVWLLVNFFIPWDLYHAWKLEELKEDLEHQFSNWVDLFYELEALNSLANFAQLNPDYTWPEFTENDELWFEAKGLGHPLIPSDKRVVNDFRIEKAKDLFLITGSNMAGKSTFLRTVGLNLALANAGAPVNASTFRSSLFRLFSSININDSLDDGLSHFYAEVRRLRKLLDELNAPDARPLFFFVDEIYKGTNNKERYAGSAAFLKEVAGKNGVGMVSSHDLELAELDKEIAQLSNWHFAETIEDGKMSFEYKIKAGPCPTTNALQIMKMEGLPIQ